MGKHRDDGEMSHKKSEEHEKAAKSDGGALGPDEGTPRKKRAGDDGALGADQGMPRSEAGGAAHAEFGGGKHEHSNHMPGTKDSPNC